MAVPENHLPIAAVQAMPFQQVERMAVAAASSNLFGVKTKEQALSIMLLAQAEGIHPMTAVRDYHIIEGKPSLKADTMLARFHAAGGTVKWNSLTDKKVEATFTHPAGGTVTIDWTIERAQQANLANKAVWKSYPRAMLRSRVVSEGIRTVCPSVIAGIYTPDEIVHGDPQMPVSVEQAVQAAATPGLLQAIVDEWLQQIGESETVDALRAVYKGAMEEARKAKDAARIGEFTLAYDAQYDLLSKPKTEPTETQQS